MKAVIPCLISSVILASCAGVSTDKLQHIATGRTIVLKAPVSYQLSVLGGTHNYTLQEGTYSERYKDSLGTYFEGTGYCFKHQVGDSLKTAEEQVKPLWFRCGIYVSNDPAVDLKIYLTGRPFQGGGTTPTQLPFGITPVTPLQGAGVAVGASIAEAFADAESANLRVAPHQPHPGQLGAALQ